MRLLRNLLPITLPGILLFVWLGPSPAAAQTSNGSLVGTVLDASGGAVPNARVEAKNVATGVAASTASGPNGEYRIGNLIAGVYSLAGSATGFTSATIGNIAVEANRTVTQNITLAVGQVTSSVEVTSAPATIDTTTANIQTTFDARMSRDLPVSSIGLGVANLSLLGAGVASNGGIGVGEGPSVGGQRPYNNNFMIEGVDANNKSTTGSLIRIIPNDAVAEFTILQNQETAQYGHSSGGQFNTIFRSGGNSFHGAVYDYLENRNLNAIDQQVQSQAFANGVQPVNPRFDSNRFGGSVSGPIIRNKLFFFGLYEYNPVGLTANPPVSAPTAQGLAQLAAMPGVSQTNLSIFRKYVPLASLADPALSADVGYSAGQLQLSGANYQNNQATVETFDYNISDRDQLRGRYIYNRLAQVDTTPNLPLFFAFNNNTYHVATLSEYHNFNPSLTNELRFGYNRLNQPLSAGNFTYPGLDAFPNLSFNDLGLDIGPADNAPQTTIQNTYQLQDNVTWVAGKHTVQTGFDGRRSISPQTFTQRSRGDYIYNSLDVFLRDLTPDYQAQRGLGTPVYYGDQYATYYYLQDTWRVRPNLTLNYGLRYEYTTVPVGERTQILNAISNEPGLITFGIPRAQATALAPRLGIAYSPGNKGTTSIRAGFGLAYDVLYDNIGILNLPPQFSTTVDVTDQLAGKPNFLANGGITPNVQVNGELSQADARANTAAYNGNQKLPYSIQWNLGVQHVFANNYTVEARYLGTRGIHLDVQQRINLRPRVTETQLLPTYLSRPSQAQLDALPLSLSTLSSRSNFVPAFEAAGFTNGSFVENAPVGWSTYHGLAVQVNRRFSNGLQFQGAYTWSHNIDNSTADFNTTALTPRRAQDFQNLTPDKASSALDRRHRLTFSAYYESNWLKNSNWFAKNLIGNWTIAPVYTYESPEYGTVQSAVDSNLNGDTAGDRAIVNPAGQEGIGSAVDALKNSRGDTVAYLAQNPDARYIMAGVGAYANGGRNTLPGRPTNNIDLNLLKNFSFTENTRIQFGAQFFNLLNHAQFVPGFINRVDNPTVLNNGPSVRAYLTPGSTTFNNPEAIFSSNPRTIQLSLKLFF